MILFVAAIVCTPGMQPSNSAVVDEASMHEKVKN